MTDLGTSMTNILRDATFRRYDCRSKRCALKKVQAPAGNQGPALHLPVSAEGGSL